MAVVTVPTTGERYVEVASICEFLAPFGIWYEQWDTSRGLGEAPSADDILSAYSAEIERLKSRGRYRTADVINVSPETPNLDALMAKYAVEHTHDEDEVRYTIAGRGVFHIHPHNGPVFEVMVETGDLINVPAGTRHWFNLCREKSIRCIRLFQDPAGWTPNYVADSVSEDYGPACWGPRHVAGEVRVAQSAVQL